MIRAVVYFLLNPLAQVFLLAALGLWLRYRGKPRWSKGCLIGAAAWLLLISATPLPAVLIRGLERQHPVYQPSPGDSTATHVVVLGGGHSIAPALPPNDQLSPMALARLVEGVRIQRQLPNSRLVCSGFSSSGRTTQAEVQARAAILLGISPADTLLQTEPHNTRAEARAYAQRFGSRTRLILVTSAVHMPRALFWFRHFGLDPLPAPTDHRIKIDPTRSPYTFRPSSDKIDMMDRWLHETVGMAWAKINTLSNE